MGLQSPLGSGYRPPRKIMILFGPTGADKCTHGPKAEETLDTPLLSTGDMLSAAVAAKSEIGVQAKDLTSAGSLWVTSLSLASSRITSKSRIAAKVATSTVSRAPRHLEVPDQSQRALVPCQGSFGGATPSKENMKDDQTGEPLMQRPDDTSTTVVPVLKQSRPGGIVTQANASQGVDAVWTGISAWLKT